MKSSTYRHARVTYATASIRAAARWTLALLSLASVSCAMEGDEACGKHQVYKTGGDLLEYAICVCDESKGYVFDQQRGYGCKRCPDDQAVADGKCVGETPDGGAEQADGSVKSEPTGVGEYCESSADCAEFDAKYCATQMRACLVDKCATGENACGSNTACCDFSHLFAGFSFCIPDEQLEDGNCPMNGMKVDP